MRLLSLFAAPLIAGLAMTAGTKAEAQDPTDVEWQLLAIDGTFYEANVTLLIGKDGALAGTGPCNRWSARNDATLPELKITGLRATRMACDRLADEQAFFAALTGMTGLNLAGPENLVLQGPDGRSMEFSLTSVIGMPDCTTCAQKD